MKNIEFLSISIPNKILLKPERPNAKGLPQLCLLFGLLYVYLGYYFLLYDLKLSTHNSGRKYDALYYNFTPLNSILPITYYIIMIYLTSILR